MRNPESATETNFVMRIFRGGVWWCDVGGFVDQAETEAYISKKKALDETRGGPDYPNTEYVAARETITRSYEYLT